MAWLDNFFGGKTITGDEAGGRATFSEVTNISLEELLAAWLTSVATGFTPLDR